jgi:hypothetical protein
MKPMRVASAPGVQRDGTVLAAQAYTDAVWCRWQRGLPRKMGGYKNTQAYLNAVSRALYSQAQSGYRYISSGTPTGVDSFTIDNTGVASGVIDPPIPATVNPTTTGLPTASINGQPFAQLNGWQFESQYDNQTNLNLLFAFCGQNQLDPANGSNFPLYCTSIYSPVNWTYSGAYASGSPAYWSNSTTAETGFVQVPGFATGTIAGFATGNNTYQALFPNGISGGICSLAPYLTVYGNNGFLAWSAPGFPTDFIGGSQGSLYVGATQITNQKIVKGLPLRGGGGYSPNGLYWSIDSLIRATFVGVPNGTFQFDQITTQSSVLSDRCILENDGTFYWAGVDRFLMYNGVIQEIQNSMNLNWFFDNINTAYAGKSFVMKIPRWGEIWWCAPLFGATEPNWAVIYNFREKTWYDTPLPSDFRSSGLHADNFVGNIMGSPTPYTYNTTNSSGSPIVATAYNLWQHEHGVDQITGVNTAAVLSSFTTAPITGLSLDPPANTGVALGILQPDFVQTGNMTVNVIKQNNAAQVPYAGNSVTIFDPATVQSKTGNAQLGELTDLKDTAKIIRLQFVSNVIGGTYQMGRVMVDAGPDGERSS